MEEEAGGGSDQPGLAAEGKEPGGADQRRRAVVKEHKVMADFWSMNRLEPEALDALDQELSDALNLPSESLSASRWEEVRSWLEGAIMDARSEDDLPAKRRLRTMVLSGVSKAQRNVKLWREMNALRSVVEEAARSKPPVRKVREAYMALSLLDGMEDQRGEQDEMDEEEEEEDSGELEELLEKALRVTKMPTSPGLSRTDGRLFGARELRRLSHDSIWLLVNSACGSVPAHQKLLYLCLCKARELYNHGKGVISLEVKQRLKRAACNGKVDSVLTLLKIAHEGRESSVEARGGSYGGGGAAKGGADDEKSIAANEEQQEVVGGGLKSSPSSGDMVTRSASHWWGHEEEVGGDGGHDDFTALRVPAVEESFTCFLSNRILRQPVTLPCGHSFSRAALEDYLRAEEEGKEERLGGGGGGGSLLDTQDGGEGTGNNSSSSTSSNSSSTSDSNNNRGGGGEGRRRCCPMPGCGKTFPEGPLSVNRALDEIISRYFPPHEEMAFRPPASPKTRAAVAMTVRGDAIEALRDIGFSEERIAQELARQPSSTTGAVRTLLKDTCPVPSSSLLDSAAISHSDLRRLNLDTTSCLIEAMSKLDPKASKASRRTVFELLCRVDWVYRDGEGAISRGARKRLQQAVVDGFFKEVDTILRFLGAPDLPSEVDVEVVLQDQLTGIVLVDPVTLGCGHTFGKAALIEYMRRRPQADRRCPLCNWAIPADFQLQIDPLVSYILARSFDDKVKSDLDSLEDALSTTPLVVTVLRSYQHNTEILVKALTVLHHWAYGGPENLSVLNFFDVVEPVLGIIKTHGGHEQLVLLTLRTLLTMSQDDALAHVMAQSGALSTLVALNQQTVGWREATRTEVKQAVLSLIVRMLLVLTPDSLSSVLAASAMEGGGLGGVQEKVLAIMEQGLLGSRSSTTRCDEERGGDHHDRDDHNNNAVVEEGGQQQPQQVHHTHHDKLSLLATLSKVAGPTWYNETLYTGVVKTIRTQLDEDWERASADAGLWTLLVKFLEKAFDATGGVKEASLAKAMARDPQSLATLERLIEKGPPVDEHPEHQQLQKQPPMFFVKHSGCSLDEASATVSATLGGGAGAEYGFGAYALGTRIPAGHAGAWEVTITCEQHQDQDPMWVSEEFIVLGICTTPSLSPDWTFYLKEDNPVSGINCQTGQVLVWGKGHAHYPPMAPGDTMRLGVDLRGSRHYMVLHKFTPGEPDRLLFRILLPEKIKAAYPAVIIFNRLSYTGRAYTAELSMAPTLPSDFHFGRWMANAEVQEKKRNGSDRGSRGSTSGSNPIKLREPLPRTFTQHADVITRTCHLGPGLQRVSGRESSSLAKKGVHTYLFRRKAGGYATVGLSDGIFESYPLLPPSAGFHLEYECNGQVRLLSRSGLVLECKIKPYNLGSITSSSSSSGASSGSGSSSSRAASNEEEEVKIEVTVSRRWDEDSMASLNVVIYKGSEVVFNEVLSTLSPLSSIRPFVGLACEGDAVSASYFFTSPEAETQTLWLSQCMTALRNIHGRGPESPTRRPSFRESHLSDHLHFLEQILSSSGCCEGEVLTCLGLLHGKLEEGGLSSAHHSPSTSSSSSSVAYWALFRALKAFPILSNSMPITSPSSLQADASLGGEDLLDLAMSEGALGQQRQVQRAQIADVTWSIISAVVEEAQGPVALAALVDAGVVTAALSSLEVLEECEGSRLAQSALDSVMKVLKAVSESPNAHQQHALVCQIGRLLSCVVVVTKDADEAEMAAMSTAMALSEKVVDIYITLLQRSLSLPSQARETLLTVRHVDRLLPFLLRRFRQGPINAQVVSALAGIMSSGDEHSCELVVFEGSMMAQPRYLPRLLPKGDRTHEEEKEGEGQQQEVEDEEDEDEEEKEMSEAEEEEQLMMMAEELMQEAVMNGTASCWTEYGTPTWGPWRAERWEEALWGALSDGNEAWVLRILSGADRWRYIRQRPCFVSQRGPWRAVLGDHGPCTVLQAVTILQKHQQGSSSGTSPVVGAFPLRIKYMERILKSVVKVPALRHPHHQHHPRGPLSSRHSVGSSHHHRGEAPPRHQPESGTVFSERADHTMANFNVDAEACAAVHGMRPGDRVRSRRYLSSFGTVIGVADDKLWIHWDEDAGASLRDDDYQYIDLEVVDRDKEAPCLRTPNSSGLWPVFVRGHLLDAEDEVDCNYQAVREGSRVTRGPTWHRNNDDGFASNLGTVVRRSGDEVTVRWDGAEHTKTYRYSTSVGSSHDVAWVFSVEDTVRAGTPLEVVRGPHWRFGNQDGGFHNSGRIIGIKSGFMVIAWNGQEGDEEEEDEEEVVEEMKEGGGQRVATRSSGAGGSSRRPKLHGYWYGKQYREVEVLLRGCERLSLVDNRKEQRMDRRGRIVDCLSVMVGSGDAYSAGQAMNVIANLAATPLPPIAYEMLYTWQVHRLLIFPAIEAFPAAREAATRALVALYTAGREPVHRIMLLKEGDDTNVGGEDRFLHILIENLSMSGESNAGLRAIGAAGLRQVLRSVTSTHRHQGTCEALKDHVMQVLQRSVSSEQEMEAFVMGIMSVLEPNVHMSVTRDLHAMRSAMALLEDLTKLWPAFRVTLERRRDALITRLNRLQGFKEVGPILGPAVVLLVTELGVSIQNPSVRELLEQVDTAWVFEKLEPFKLLRSGSWPIKQLRHILRASAAHLEQVTDEYALLEVVVLEEALDMYLRIVDTAMKEGITQWGPALAAALDCLRLLEQKLGVMHDELIRRGLPVTLRNLLVRLSCEAGSVGPQVTTSFFILLEVMSARHSGEGFSDGSEESFLLRPDAIEVSSGTRDRVHLVDGHPSTCWVSQDRVHFPGVVVERRAGASTSRAIRRPESSGHSITIRLPPPPPSPSAVPASTTPRSRSTSTTTSGTATNGTSTTTSSSRVRRPSRSSTPPSPRDSTALDDLLALSLPLAPSSSEAGSSTTPPPPESSSSSACDGSSSTMEWSKLQIRRGMYGNYTPAEFWVLAQLGPDRFFLVKKHNLKDSKAGSWETILERRELDEAIMSASSSSSSSTGGAVGASAVVVESIRIEIYRNVNMGNNSKVNGLRFVAGESEEGPMVTPEPLLAFLRDYKGSGHQWLAPALSVLNRVSNDSAFEALRIRKEQEGTSGGGSGSGGASGSTSSSSSSSSSHRHQHVHVGSFVRCRWSKSNGMHPAVITAVHPNRIYDVHYHDGDRDFGRPRHALEPLDDMRDLNRAQSFFDEVIRRVRQNRAYGFFHPHGSTDDHGSGSGRPLARPRGLRELYLGDVRRAAHDVGGGSVGGGGIHSLSRESAVSDMSRDFLRSVPPLRTSELRGASVGVASSSSSSTSTPGGASAAAGPSSGDGNGNGSGSASSSSSSYRGLMGQHEGLLREATRLRDSLQEAQRALLEGAGADEAARAQIEEQVRVYERLMEQQERRLLELMRAEGDRDDDRRHHPRTSTAAAAAASGESSPIFSTEGDGGEEDEDDDESVEEEEDSVEDMDEEEEG